VRDDRGSATPLAVAFLAVAAISSLAFAEFVEGLRNEHRARLAAEALAVGAVLGVDLDVLARELDVATYSIDRLDTSVTIRVERAGSVASATADDHRHTLGVAE